ncbi:MAG: hypothetical protein Q8O67_09625 [Deltaproteobacteria bacterium]|nr:hypothetical protein [Deltaproteobacteria bacterium]
MVTALAILGAVLWFGGWGLMVFRAFELDWRQGVAVVVFPLWAIKLLLDDPDTFKGGFKAFVAGGVVAAVGGFLSGFTGGPACPGICKELHECHVRLPASASEQTCATWCAALPPQEQERLEDAVVSSVGVRFCEDVVKKFAPWR